MGLSILHVCGLTNLHRWFYSPAIEPRGWAYNARTQDGYGDHHGDSHPGASAEVPYERLKVIGLNRRRTRPSARRRPRFFALVSQPKW
jgi:hypothetical protein